MFKLTGDSLGSVGDYRSSRWVLGQENFYIFRVPSLTGLCGDQEAGVMA